jgi:SAM-dependent methyltransferase
MTAMRMGILQHIARDTLASLRHAGVHNTLRIIASTVRDSDFDRTYGTDTAGYQDPRTYARDDPRAQRATLYVPTRATPFLSFLQRSGAPLTGTFVDFGCGKGRAMFVAALYGFQSVTGIEFSPTLCSSALRNIERFQTHASETRFEVICGSAGDYEVRPQDSTFYFYDPFDDDLIEQCLENVKASIDERSRQVTVLYHNSIAAPPAPFRRSDFLFETPLPRFSGNAFYLFSSRPPSARAEPHRTTQGRSS